MKRAVSNIGLPVFLLLSISFYMLIFHQLGDTRGRYLQQRDMDYTLPSRITSVTALEFKGIVSDFLFLKVSTFLGEKFLKKEMLQLEHAEYIYHSVDAITDLDPWFWDAYLFANMLLSWDFRQVDKANTLLKKAMTYRDTDYKPPYFIGFNYFYFLKDNKNGSDYMMKAAKIPGSPSYIPGLASRLSAYSNQYGPAIVFLNDILKTTQSPELKAQYEERLKALVTMDRLEKAVAEYQAQFGRFPEKLSDLVAAEIISDIPEDPYGGKFYLTKNKRVYTTSKLVHSRPQINKNK